MSDNFEGSHGAPYPGAWATQSPDYTYNGEAGDEPFSVVIPDGDTFQDVLARMKAWHDSIGNPHIPPPPPEDPDSPWLKEPKEPKP